MFDLNVDVPLNNTTETSNDKHIDLINNNRVKRDSFYLYFSVCVASLLSFSGGAGLTWTSSVIPKLKLPENPLNISVTTIQISLIASLYDISQALGPYIFVYMFNRFNRKVALIWINVLFLTGNVLMGFFEDIRVYYFARFIMGAAFGGSAAIIPMYITEITEVHNREKFNCLAIVFNNLGLLYSFVVGPFYAVKTFNFLCSLPAIVFLVLWKFLPDSPIHLIIKGDDYKSEYVLKKLSGKSTVDTKYEIRNIKKLIEEGTNFKRISYLKIIRSKLFLRKFFVSFGFMMGVPLSGIMTILAFSQQIFIESGSFIQSEYLPILIGFWITLITFFIFCYIIKSFGRKTLMIFGSFGTTISLAFMTVFFLLKRYLPNSIKHTSWVSFSLTILYLSTFQCYGTVIWTVLNEIFWDPNTRVLAVSVLTSFYLLGMFLSAFFFPIISEYWGMAEVFLLHTIFSLLESVFIYFFVPETKHRSYQEIENYFL